MTTTQPLAKNENARPANDDSPSVEMPSSQMRCVPKPRAVAEGTGTTQPASSPGQAPPTSTAKTEQKSGDRAGHVERRDTAEPRYFACNKAPAPPTNVVSTRPRTSRPRRFTVHLQRKWGRFDYRSLIVWGGFVAGGLLIGLGLCFRISFVA